MLEVLAQSGNSSNLAELPHLELRVRIASAPGQVDLIRQETIDAVNGPVLPKLQDRGVNASFLQLTSLGTVRPTFTPFETSMASRLLVSCGHLP